MALRNMYNVCQSDEVIQAVITQSQTQSLFAALHGYGIGSNQANLVLHLRIEERAWERSCNQAGHQDEFQAYRQHCEQAGIFITSTKSLRSSTSEKWYCLSLDGRTKHRPLQLSHYIMIFYLVNPP